MPAHLPVALANLAQTPSRPAWRSLCAALDRDPSVHDLPALEAALTAWPDTLRVLPGRWLHALLHGVEHPALPLVATLRAQLFDITFPQRFAWAHCAALRNLTQLHLHDERLGDRGVDALAASAHLPRLGALSLSRGITASGARVLATAASLPQLYALDLSRNDLGPDGIAALAHADPWVGLRALHLGRNALGAEGLRAVAASRWQPLRLDLDTNRLDGAALVSLVASPVLSRVTTLNLSNNPIGRAGCEALAASRLDALEVLYLHGCDLTDDAVAPLWGAPWLSHLTNLAVSGNRLGTATLDALATHPALGGLHELDVCGNAVDAQDARTRLEHAEALRGVRRLCV